LAWRFPAPDLLADGDGCVVYQVENPGGSRLRVLQNKLQEQLGFAIPLIKGADR